MKRSENSDRAIIDSVPVMAWTSRPDGFIEFLSPLWFEYTGFSSDKAFGWGWTAAIHPDDRERVTNRWRELLASGQRGEIEARMYRGARVSLGSRPGGTGQERPGRYRQMVRD